jgi:hypothetical protein
VSGVAIFEPCGRLKLKIGLNKIVFSGKLGEKGLHHATPFF